MNEGSNMLCLSCGSCTDGGGRCRCGGEGDEFGRLQAEKPEESRRRLTKNTAKIEVKTDYSENGHGTWHASKA